MRLGGGAISPTHAGVNPRESHSVNKAVTINLQNTWLANFKAETETAIKAPWYQKAFNAQSSLALSPETTRLSFKLAQGLAD